MRQNDAEVNMRKIVALVIKSYAYACSCCHIFAMLDKSEVEDWFASASERNSKPRNAGRRTLGGVERRSRGTPVRVRNLNGTQGTCGDRMRGLNCRIDHKTNALKKRATPARSFASLRSSPLYVTTGSLGSISFFVAIQGFGASSLRFLRPRRPFADAHSTACLRAAAPLPRGLKFRSLTLAI